MEISVLDTVELKLYEVSKWRNGEVFGYMSVDMVERLVLEMES